VLENLEEIRRDLRPGIVGVVGESRHRGNEMIPKRSGHFDPALDLLLECLVRGIQEIRDSISDGIFRPAAVAPQPPFPDFAIVLRLDFELEVAITTGRAGEVLNEVPLQMDCPMTQAA
jgi:hypothetical protein